MLATRRHRRPSRARPASRSSYTNVFWGGRSEIKPSEIMPDAYVAWCAANGIDPASMKEGA